MASIFISHSSKDRDFARRLGRDIEKSGHRVWIDVAELRVGDSLIENIQDAVSSMDYLGVILSEESIKSKWVRLEVETAMTQELHGARVKVLPLLKDRVAIPGFLKGKLYADFTSDEDYESGLRAVIRRLKDSPMAADVSPVDTSFWEFSHLQGSGATDDEDPLGGEGSSWFEFEILGDDDDQLRSSAVRDTSQLPGLVKSICPMLGVLSGCGSRGFHFGHATTVVWEKTEYWPLLQRHNVVVFGSRPVGLPYDGYCFEISRKRVMFQPYLGGNSFKNPRPTELDPIIEKLAKQLKPLVCKLVGISAREYIFSDMQAYDELPREGGFGYMMGWARKLIGR